MEIKEDVKVYDSGKHTIETNVANNGKGGGTKTEKAKRSSTSGKPTYTHEYEGGGLFGKDMVKVPDMVNYDDEINEYDKFLKSDKAGENGVKALKTSKIKKGSGDVYGNYQNINADFKIKPTKSAVESDIASLQTLKEKAEMNKSAILKSINSLLMEAKKDDEDEEKEKEEKEKEEVEKAEEEVEDAEGEVEEGDLDNAEKKDEEAEDTLGGLEGDLDSDIEGGDKLLEFDGNNEDEDFGDFGQPTESAENENIKDELYNVLGKLVVEVMGDMPGLNGEEEGEPEIEVELVTESKKTKEKSEKVKKEIKKGKKEKEEKEKDKKKKTKEIKEAIERIKSALSY